MDGNWRESVELVGSSCDTTTGLLSGEMNLLNNLCLMALSIIFCFCARLYFSLAPLMLCGLLFCIIFFPSVYPALLMQPAASTVLCTRTHRLGACDA